jgi:hypothetical protein
MDTDSKINSRFSSEMAAINQKIAEFNEFLNPKYRVPSFNADTMIQDGCCVQILHGNWDGFRWPNPTKRGVYFIFGREKTTDKNGFYIGKASFSSKMGARLDSHLRPHKNNEQFLMNGYNDEKYILDYMVTIDLDCLNVGFLASALEEFLITQLKSNLKLINGTGN